MKLFVLANSVWHSDDYLNSRNTNPMRADKYLFLNREDAENKAENLECDFDIYNDCTIYQKNMTEDEIMSLLPDDVEDMNDFIDNYLTNPHYNSELKEEICNHPDDEDCIEGANYDFDKSLDGAILIVWSWHRYTGYARKCEEIRYAYYKETEEVLTKQDRTFVSQVDVLLTAEEVEECKDDEELKERLMERCFDGTWKWTNPGVVEDMIDSIV